MKSNWSVVYDEHFDYMRKMVTVVMNRYKGKVEESMVVPDEFTNSLGQILFLNLWEEGDLRPLLLAAFKRAYEAWDGVREFRPLYRQTFLNLVSNEERKLKKHRMLETQMSFFENDDGVGLDAVDERIWEDPATVCDFVDFINTMEEQPRLLVTALLNAEEVFGLTHSPPIKELLSSAYDYARDVLGMSHRAYYATMQDIKEKLMERSKQNVTHKICGLGYRQSSY